MKKTLSLVLALGIGASFTIQAQQGPGPGPGGEEPKPEDPKNYEWNYSWNNYFKQEEARKAGSGAQEKSGTEAPATWTHRYQNSLGEKSEGAEAGKARVGQPEMPVAAREMIQKFQTERNRLRNQLKTASDEERRQILQELEQLRTQLREQASKLREQARQQAEQMRERFGNQRDRLLEQGAGSGSGRGGRDR